MYNQGVSGTLNSFNNLFNKRLTLAFFNILSRKNWRGGVELLFEVGIMEWLLIMLLHFYKMVR